MRWSVNYIKGALEWKALSLKLDLLLLKGEISKYLAGVTDLLVPCWIFLLEIIRKMERASEWKLFSHYMIQCYLILCLYPTKYPVADHRVTCSRHMGTSSESGSCECIMYGENCWKQLLSLHLTFLFIQSSTHKY